MSAAVVLRGLMPTLIRVAPDPIDVSEYLYIAEIVTRKFYHGKEPIRDTDLFAVACLELAKCKQIYDPKIGPFDRFAFRSIKHGLIDHLRDQKNKIKPIQIPEWFDLPAKDNRNYGSLHQVISSLPEDDRKLIDRIYLQKLTMKEVAEGYGVSRVTIYSRLEKILQSLRERINEFNDFNEG